MCDESMKYLAKNEFEKALEILNTADSLTS